MLIDTHAHLNFDELSDTQAVLYRAKEAGVDTIINIGTNLKDSQKGTEIAQKFPNIYTTVGTHPNDETNTTSESVDWPKFEMQAKSPKVVAIGECGLDYSRNSGNVSPISEEKERQKNLFIQQVKIAHKLNLPLSLHIRDAYEDILNLLSQVPHPVRAVFHCMSGTPDYLDSLLQLKLRHEFYFSFAGNVTFKNAQTIRELARLVPLDRLLTETDAPFLAPEPHRGTQNEPANVKLVALKLAEVKGLQLDQIGKITSENARRLFNL